LLVTVTRTADMLLMGINVNDLERSWTSQRVLVIFRDFRLRRQRRTLQEWIATKWLEINRRQPAKRNCY